MSRTKETIRDDLLKALAEARAMGGYIIPPIWLEQEYLPSLNLRETGLYDEAMAGLVEEGLIEKIGDDIPAYKLTARGMEYIN